MCPELFLHQRLFLAQITAESDVAGEIDARPDDSQFTGEDLPVEENTNGRKTVNVFGRLMADFYIKRTQQETLRMFRRLMMLK